MPQTRKIFLRRRNYGCFETLTETKVFQTQKPLNYAQRIPTWHFSYITNSAFPLVSYRNESSVILN